jgi:hypothetical protein
MAFNSLQEVEEPLKYKNVDAIGDAIDVDHDTEAVANDGKNTCMEENPVTD